MIKYLILLLVIAGLYFLEPYFSGFLGISFPSLLAKAIYDGVLMGIAFVLGSYTK